MILKIVGDNGAFYYADQIHRCAIRPCEEYTVEQILQDPSKVPHDSILLDPKSPYPLRQLTYRTLADGLARPYIVLFNVRAYFLDDRGHTIEKL